MAMRRPWKRPILSFLAALATCLGLLPSAYASYTCVDIFKTPQSKWTVQDAIEMIREVNPTRVEAYTGELNLFTRISLYPLASKLRPEVLRETGDYKQAGLIIDNVIKRDQYIRSLLQRRFRLPETDRPTEWISRKILSDGLQSLIEANSLGMHRRAFRDRLSIVIRRLLTKKPIYFANEAASLQFRLPNAKDRIVPDQLLADVMIDGPAAHRSAIEEAYKQSRQNRVEFYRKLDSLYRITAWAISIAMIPQTIEMAGNIYTTVVTGHTLDALSDEVDALSATLDKIENIFD